MIVTDLGALVDGIPAPASEPRTSRLCATLGPRSFMPRCLGVSAEADVNVSRARRNRGQKQKGPPRPEPGGPGGKECCLFRPSRPPQVASGTRFPCLFHRALKTRDVDLVEIKAVSTLRRQRLDVEQLAGDFVEHLSPGGFRYARCWPLAGGLLGCGCHGTSINHSGAPGRQRNNRGVPARTARFRVTGVSRGAALKCRPPARVRRTPCQELKRNPGARPRTSG